jgi:hypothetical protein
VPRKALLVPSSEEERNKIDQLARSRAEEARLVQRDRITRHLLGGRALPKQPAN